VELNGMNKTILIIDKGTNDFHILRERLERVGFMVHITTDHKEGFNSIFKLNPQLIIYSYYLFLLSEDEFNEKITSNKTFIPIIMIHSSDKEEDILQAFDKGAADYITEPFSPREVEGRIKAILRRMDMSKSPEEEDIKIGNLIFRPRHHEIDLKTHKDTLSIKEQQLFLFLVERKVISREEIIRFVWGFDYYGGCRIVDVNISNLRKKIEENPKNPQYIKTIKGYGYRLEEPALKKVETP
jgi:two-component system, OmpR family, alkaline phosphatase synthesis response regulator PhoP